MGKYRKRALAKRAAIVAVEDTQALFAARVAASTIIIGLDSVTSGAAENVVIGLVTSTGMEASEIVSIAMTDTAGGKFKLVAPNVVKTGATATNVAVDASPGITVLVTYLYGLTKSASAEITVNAVAPSAATVTMPTLRKALLAGNADVLAFINATPTGNVITLSKTAGDIELTRPPATPYASGDLVMPAPDVTFTSDAAAWASWTEDGNARTMMPDYSEAEGNGTGALGQNALTGVVAPNLRLKTVWFRRFTGKLVFIWEASFEDEDGNDAMDKVRMYAAGKYVDMTTRTTYRYTDVNGIEQYCDGDYICELDAANYTSGLTGTQDREMQVFARAYSTIPGVSSQLVGRHTKGMTFGSYDHNLHSPKNLLFYPALTTNDVLIHLDPTALADSKPGGTWPSVNAIFRDVGDAIAYSRNTTVNGLSLGSVSSAPKIHAIASGTNHPVSRAQDPTGQRGFVDITHEPGVEITIGRPGPMDHGTTASQPNHVWQPSRGALHFAGKGWIFDQTYLTNIKYNVAYGGVRPGWMDGFQATCEYNMVNRVDDNGVSRTGIYFTTLIGGGWLTDAWDASFVGAEGLWLSRNNNREWGEAGGDMYNRVFVGYGDIIRRHGINQFRTVLPMLEITALPAGYRVNKWGAEGNLSHPQTLRLEKFDSLTGTWDIEDAAHSLALKGTGSNTQPQLWLRVSEAVAWLNSWPGVTAITRVTPNDRITDRNMVFAQATTYPATALTLLNPVLVSRIDQHLDLAQGNAVETSSPSVWINNRTVRCVRVQDADWMQDVFPDADVYNVLLSNVAVWQNPYTNASQWTYERKRNHRVRHFSDPNQGVTFTNSKPSNYLGPADSNWWANYPSIDVYTQSYGNEFARHTWTLPSTATALPVLRKDHYVANYAGDAGAQVSEQVSSGGTALGNHPGIADGDWRPGGQLVLPENMITTTDYVDCQGIYRDPASTHKGAATLGLPNGTTVTKAQALTVQAVSCVDIARANTVSLSRRSGVGETGDIETLVISVEPYKLVA